jgi:predicted nucleotidyltransferase component of viral defense system
MISKEEIIALADQTGLTPLIIEKDYVLGWLLAGIYRENSVFQDAWIFKGGTCLKKCFFETYRFSEDLDFTLKDESKLEERFLNEQFMSISEWLYENVGIKTPANRFIFDIYKNSRDNLSCEVRIYYCSYFVSGKRSMPKIKLDLTADEAIVMPPVDRRIYHNYSDEPEEGIIVKCYSYEEVFGEKVRALGERGRPRDLYDVINLFRNDYLPVPEIVSDILSQKCSYKGIEIPSMEGMEDYYPALLGNWEPMLSHQLPQLPSLQVYWEALPDFFAWLEGQAVPSRVELSSVSREGEIYRPTYGHLELRDAGGNSLEIIRFAAGNRLCVDLQYQSSVRRIEPYSLRRTSAGKILLYAVKSDTGKIRSYRVDRIEGASVTNQVFTPRYQVELTPMGQLHISNRVGNSTRLGLPKKPSEKIRKTSTKSLRRTRHSSFSSGITYIFRCPVCDKTFRRKTYNSRLNPHKNKKGWPCSGRIGYHEDTVY